MVRYLALAHNERNERGVPVAKVIHNLGREDMLDREALERLVASIQRFLGGEQALRAGAPHGFDFVCAPECGGAHVVDALWGELGIGRAIARVAGDESLRDTLRARGLARAASCSWDRTARQTLDVYRRVAKGRG